MERARKFEKRKICPFANRIYKGYPSSANTFQALERLCNARVHEQQKTIRNILRSASELYSHVFI